MQQILLQDLLKHLDKYDETLNLAFTCQEISSQSRCTLLTDRELNKQNFQIIIGLYTIKDILDNLYLQKKDFSMQEAVNAINFYLNNDAFIVLPRKGLVSD